VAISGSASASPAAKKGFDSVRLATVWLMLKIPVIAARTGAGPRNARARARNDGETWIACHFAPVKPLACLPKG
jgi:hypothetical protein